MRPGVTLESRNPQISFIHYILRTLIGSDHRIEMLEIILKVIAEIQIIAMLFSFPFEVLPNTNGDSFGIFTDKITKYISFKHILTFNDTSNLNNFLISLFLFYIIFMILIAALIANAYYSRARAGSFLLSIWKNNGVFFYTTAFLLIYQFALSMVDNALSSDFILWLSDISLPFFIIGCWLAIISSAFAVFFCTYLFEPLKTTYLVAARTSLMDILPLAYKIIDPPLDLFLLNSDVRKWIRVILMIIIFGFRLRVFLVRVPYYYYNAMSLFLKFSFLQFGLSIINLFMMIFGATIDTHSFVMIYFGGVIVAFLPKISSIVLMSKIKRDASKDMDTIKSANDFHWRLFALDTAINMGVTISKIQRKSMDSDYEYIFYGILSSHKARCHKKGCGCRLLLKYSENLTPNTSPAHIKDKDILQNLKFELLRELYREGVKKFPFDTEIKIGLANLIFENKRRSYAPSISLVHTLNFAEQSIQIRVLAVMLLEKIESKLISDYANSINIKEIVDFQAASQKLRILIESSTAKFLNFWETYKAPDPPIMKLYNCSEVLNKEADQISAMWERITRDYKKLSYPDHLLYGLYQSLVRSAPYSAEKILRTYFSFANAYDPEKIREFLVTPENVHESNNILVCIAMKREKLGIVTFITPNVEEILQFKQSDVIDKDVNLMMPDFFRERHKRILLAHVESSRTTIFNRNRQVFTQKKDGYIIPFTIYVTMFPYFQGELSYFGLLRPMSTFDDFMLVLSDGTIDSFTENIGKALNLNPQTLKKYKLSDISKDLARLHKALLPFATGEGGPRKSNFYSKRQSNGLSFFESSYSFGKQNTATLDNVGQPNQLVYKKEEDEVEVEDDVPPGGNKNTSRLNSADLIRAYDLFTSTGVATSLYPIGGSRHIEEAKLEYTAIISEENILGNHLRVFRFQSTATDEDMARNTQMLTEIRDDQTEPLKSEIRSQKLQSEYSVAWTVIPADQGIKMRTEEEINFRNPFYVKSSMEDSGATPGISMKNTKSSNEHQTDQLQGKDLEGQKPESPIDINNLVLKKTSSAWKTAKLEGSREEEIPEKQVKLEKVQLKKFLRDNQIILGDDQVDKNSVTSQAKADKVNAKLERAIHLDDKEFSFRVLTYSIVCFCFLSVGMVIYLYIMAEANLTEVRNNINILELSSDRAREIVEIDRNSRMIYLFQKGLAPLVRHTDDDAISNQLGLRELALNVSLLNNRLRSEIYKIHSTDQSAFYALNRVETKQALTKIRQINSFDLVTELSSAALELYNLLWNKPDADDQKLRFILDNSLNDFLVNNDAAIQILKENSSVAIQDIETTIIDILIIRISCGLVILSFVIKIQISFVKMRSRLLDVFLTIKDFEVEQSLSIVNSFYSYLQENRKEHYLLEKIVNSKTNPYSKISVQKKQQSKAFKAKTGYFKGTNVPIIVNLLITSICLSVFVILLCILLRIFASARQSMDSSRLNVINAKTSLYKFELAFTSLYEYITEDGTTKVANIEIGSNLQANYDYLSSHNTLLTSLVKEDSSNAEINYLLQGDLCGLLSQNQSCYYSNSGVISKGLLAMNGQMLKAIKQVKDFYDSSDKSNASKTIALTMKDLIDAEELYDNFMKRTYVELDHVLMESLLDSISTFSITNLVFITFAVVTCLTLTKYLFLLVRTRMEDQRRGYKNFMRIIPVNIIMNNRFLKSYLMNNSKSILDSVKNKI